MDKTKVKLPALFCLTCFEDGKNPVHYSLNRSNESTKKKNVPNINIKGSYSKQAKIKYCSPKEITAREPLECWKKWHSKEGKRLAKPKAKKDLF